MISINVLNPKSVEIRISAPLTVHNCQDLEEQLAKQRADIITIDLDQCAYISSAGLRVLLSQHRKQSAGGGTLQLINVPEPVQRVFDITGFSDILDYKPKLREISLDGCEFISAGVCGECYRIDEETIVKLYGEGIAEDIAEKEKLLAKSAFVQGVPTAISYDLVRCGKRTGVVYEMLEAELFSNVIINDLDNIKAYAKRLSDTVKLIHAIEGDPGVVPNIKNKFVDYINQMDFFLSRAEIDLLQEKLQAIPDSRYCVHFDLHTSNIMIRNDELLIIDLGDFSIGSYLFDIGLICMIYGLPELNICELATKIPAAKGRELWEVFLEEYFADKPRSEYDFFVNHQYFLASLRIIYTITFLPKLRALMCGLLKEQLLPKIKQTL